MFTNLSYKIVSANLLQLCFVHLGVVACVLDLCASFLMGFRIAEQSGREVQNVLGEMKDPPISEDSRELINQCADLPFARLCNCFISP